MLVAATSVCSPSPPTPDVEFRIPVEAVEAATGTVEELVVATGILGAWEIVGLTIETPGYLQVARDENGDRLAEGSKVAAG